MERACINTEAFQGVEDIPRTTLNNTIAGESICPRTIGYIAEVLNINVTQILVV